MYKKSFIAFVIGLTMVVTPLLALAQTQTQTQTMSLSNLQAEIQTLLVRIQTLQTQLRGGTATAGVATSSVAVAMPNGLCYSFNRSLSTGTQGDDVRTLQQFLLSHGFSIPAGATGYFGSQTQTALAAWQAKNNIVATINAGSGIFGQLSRGAFSRWCGNGQGTGGTSTTTPPVKTSSVFSLSANPQLGTAPLRVSFTSSAPITSSSTLSVDFGDQSANVAMTPDHCIAIMAVVGGQGGIRCSASTTHTYTTNGIYTARLINNTCPVGAFCFVGPLTVATTSITVTASTSNGMVQLNAPGSATLALGDIAEVRNQSMYFTLTSLTSVSATIQPTAVGCWNSFPSDTPPQIRCMIAVMPIAPQTLAVGQSYHSGNYSITLTAITNNKATFAIITTATQ